MECEPTVISKFVEPSTEPRKATSQPALFLSQEAPQQHGITLVPNQIGAATFQGFSAESSQVPLSQQAASNWDLVEQSQAPAPSSNFNIEQLLNFSSDYDLQDWVDFLG